MSQPQQSFKKILKHQGKHSFTNELIQNQNNSMMSGYPAQQHNLIPNDIHNIVSPSKAQKFGYMNSSSAFTEETLARKTVQTVDRDLLQKNRTQRENSHNNTNVREFRAVKTDRRGQDFPNAFSQQPIDEDLGLQQQNSENVFKNNLTSSQERSIDKKETEVLDLQNDSLKKGSRADQLNNKFDGTTKFNLQQLHNNLDSKLKYQMTQQNHLNLRESNDSVRSIQKQRIQRSLQKSQEGRKRVEERLEALLNKDKQNGTQQNQYQNNNEQQQTYKQINTPAQNNRQLNIMRNNKQSLTAQNQQPQSFYLRGGSGLAQSANKNELYYKDQQQYKESLLQNLARSRPYNRDSANGDFESTQNISGYNQVYTVVDNSYNCDRNNLNTKQANSLIENNLFSPINKENLEKIHILRQQNQFQFNQTQVNNRCSDQVLSCEPRDIQISQSGQKIEDRNFTKEKDRNLMNNSRASSSYQSILSYHPQPQNQNNNQNDSQDGINSQCSVQNYQSIKCQSQLQNKKTNSINNLGGNNDKIYTSILDAQPMLRHCIITSNYGGMTQVLNAANESCGFSQLLLGNNHPSDLSEIDKNLICPKCQLLVVNPVECLNCQYIICQICAKETNNYCDESDCGQKFTQQPGKIHKLYKEKLNALEFRCPNSQSGCQKTYFYDQIDHHLQNQCDARQQCPNKCSKTKKFHPSEIAKHIEECPKECIPCPQCKQIKFRMEIPEHIDEFCDKSQVKCEICGQNEIRINLKNKLHQCTRNSQQSMSILNKQKLDQKFNNYIRSMNDYRESHGLLESQSEQETRFSSKNNSISTSLGTNQLQQTNIQLKIIKEDVLSLQSLITEEVYQMIDNLSQALTEKESEVSDLKIKYADLESRFNTSQESNQKLQFQIQNCQNDILQLQAHIKTQGENHQEVINSLSQLHSEQVEESQKYLLQKIQNQNQKFIEYETKFERMNQIVIAQQDKFGDILQQFNRKIEKQESIINLLNNDVMKEQKSNYNALNSQVISLQEQMNYHKQFQIQNQDKTNKQISQLTNFVDKHYQVNSSNFNSLQFLINEKIQEEMKNAQFKQSQDFESMKQYFLEQLKVFSLKQKNQKPKKNENMDNISGASDSLDEEIYIDHYQRLSIGQTNEQTHKNFIVPPIDFQSALQQKQVKNQKQIKNSPNPASKMYQEDNLNSQSISNRKQDTKESSMVNQSCYSNKQQDQSENYDQNQSLEILSLQITQNGHKNIQLQSEQIIQQNETKNSYQEEDESKQLPAYLSQAEENEATCLNNTLLNTEFNSSRPIFANNQLQNYNDCMNSARYTANGSEMGKDSQNRNTQNPFNSIPQSNQNGKGRFTERAKQKTQKDIKNGGSYGQTTNELSERDDSSFKISQSTHTSHLLTQNQEQFDIKQIDIDINQQQIYDLKKQNEIQIQNNENSNDRLCNDQQSYSELDIQKQYILIEAIRQSTKSGIVQNNVVNKITENSDNMSFKNESDFNTAEQNQNQLIQELMRDSNQDFKQFIDRQSIEQFYKLININQNQINLPNTNIINVQDQQQDQINQNEDHKQVQNENDNQNSTFIDQNANPYNENLVQTYGSSEFNQPLIELLPGQIFSQQDHKNTQQNQEKIQGLEILQLTKNSSRDQQQTPVSIGTQSIGSINVNMMIDQNKNEFQNFYELANNIDGPSDQLINQERQKLLQLLENSNKSQQNIEQLIQEKQDFNEDVFYANIEKLLLSGIGDDSVISQNNLRGKTLKIKGQQCLEIQKEESYKQIEEDIKYLQNKYYNQNKQNEKIKDDSQSDEFDRENEGATDNKSSQLDNIINSVLDGKHLFKQRVSQICQNQEIKIQQNSSMVFEIYSENQSEKNENVQNSVANKNHYETYKQQKDNQLQQNIQKLVIGREVQENDEWGTVRNSMPNLRQDIKQESFEKKRLGSQGSGRSSKHSQELQSCYQKEENNGSMIFIDKEEDQNDINYQPIPTSLESDLGTILETDQESNFMTTARTNQQKSQVIQQQFQKQIENNPEEEKEIDINEIQLNEKESNIMEQKNNLNDSSFINIPESLLQQADLPLNLYQQMSDDQKLSSIDQSLQIKQNQEYFRQQNVQELYQSCDVTNSISCQNNNQDQYENYKQVNLQSANQQQKCEMEVKKSNENYSSCMISDISPIANKPMNDDQNQSQYSRYTNLLDSYNRIQKDLETSAQQMNPLDSDKLASTQRKLNVLNPFKQLRDNSLLDLLGSPNCSIEEASFLISERSILVPDIKQIADILANKRHFPQKKDNDEIINIQDQKDSIEINEEDRIKQYQIKVLSAIAEGAKKKQQEQSHLMNQIQKHSMSDEKNQQRKFQIPQQISMKHGALTNSLQISEQSPNVNSSLESEINRELQQIMSKNKELIQKASQQNEIQQQNNEYELNDSYL